MAIVIHNFKVGDRITVTDYFTSTGYPYSSDHYVKAIEGEYYILKDVNSTSKWFGNSKMPFSYPHMKLSTYKFAIHPEHKAMFNLN